MKAPRSCPYSSDSISSAGTPTQFTAMKGPFAHGLCTWISRATISLPVPDSPRTSTVPPLVAMRAMRRNSVCIGSPRPSRAPDASRFPMCRRIFQISPRCRRCPSPCRTVMARFCWCSGLAGES